MTERARVLDDLIQVIRARRDASPDDSYTARLLAAGVGPIGEKVLEEAQELARAAVDAAHAGGARDALVHEAADLVYHALVLLEASGVSWNDVLGELARRFGASGLAEKAARARE